MFQKLKDLQLQNKSLQWPEGSGTPATMDDVCSHAELAWPALEISGDSFDIRMFVPMPADLYLVSNEGLDRKLIKLYSTTDSNYAVWWRPTSEVNDESPIYLNHYLSAGDVAGIRLMYPDIDPNVSLHPPAPTSFSRGLPNVPPRQAKSPSKSPSNSRQPPPKPLRPTSLRPSGLPVPAEPSAFAAPEPPSKELVEELDNVGF